MSRKSGRTSDFKRTTLHIEELEERIAPVIVDATHWVQGFWDSGAGTGSDYNAWGTDGSNSDWYFIMYVGPGQADIRNTAGGGDLTGYDIGNITITGSTIDSGLFILQVPLLEEPSIEAATVPWIVDVGTLWVQGNITVDGDIGCIEIDGAWADLAGGNPVLFVNGTLGKLDVGTTGGTTVHAEGDIWEVHVDSSFGEVYDNDPLPVRYVFGNPTTVEANGNIGQVIIGAGLTGNGDSPSTTSIIGGYASQDLIIRANADEVGDRGIIDLVRVYAGNVLSGSLGYGLGDEVPVLDPGPGGNLRFLHIDGDAWYTGPSGSSGISTNIVGIGTPISERMLVDDSGGIIVINPQGVTFPSTESGWTWDDFLLAHSSDTSSDPDYQDSVLEDLGVTSFQITYYEPAIGDIVPISMRATPIGGDPIITYYGFVEYLLIPMARGGSAICRMVAHGSNTFGITGNVEIGDFSIGGDNVEYAEGLAEDFEDLVDDNGNPIGSIDELPFQSAGEITGLSGYARDVFVGSGECDIYFLNATTQFGVSTVAGGISTVIPIVLNNTHDGDIVGTYATNNIIFVGASQDGGDLGATESISPYLIRTNMQYQDGDVLWVDGGDAAGIQPQALESNLMRYNSIQGVLTTGGNIYGLRAGGAIGDIRAAGDGNIHLVVADSNQTRDPGSPLVSANIVYVSGLPGYGYTNGNLTFFGRVDNQIGDGIFGKVFTGTGGVRDSVDTGIAGSGFIGNIRVGEAVNPSQIDYDTVTGASNYGAGGGYYLSAGIFSPTYIDSVVVSQYGADENGIYCHIVASGADDETGYALNRIAALNGAVIDGSQAFGSWIAICATSTTVVFGPYGATGVVGNVTAQGAGSIIANVFFSGNQLHNITTSGGTDGFWNCSVLLDNGGLDSMSIDGAGIMNSTFFIDGSAGRIQTTGKTGIIGNTEMRIQYGLRSLRTWGLEDSYIQVTNLNSLSRLDHMTNTTFLVAGIQTMNVANDITGSLIRFAGPLTTFTVGGELTNTTVASVGVHANIGRVMVNGDITGGAIFSEHNINIVQSRSGSIDTDITALGSGDLDADLTIVRDAHINRVSAAGGISGSISVGWLDNENADLTRDTVLNARLGSVTAGGAISADINVGAVAWTGNTIGDVYITAVTGAITAKGSITGNITVGAVMTSDGGVLQPGDIDGDVRIATRMAAVRSDGNVDGDIAVGIIQSANDINGDVAMNARLAGITAKGAINGDVTVGAVAADGNINGTVTVPETVGAIRADGAVTGDITVGTVDSFGGSINGEVTYAARLASIRAGGDVTGDIRVGNWTEAILGPTLISGRGDIGSVMTQGSFTGSLYAGRNVGSIKAAGDIGDDLVGTMVLAGKNLGTLSAGGRTSPGNLYSDVAVGGNLGSLLVNGTAPVSMTVAGNTSRVSINGHAGELGDTWDFGGRVGALKIGDPLTTFDLFADVTIGGNLGSLAVTGNIGNPDPAGPRTTFNVDGNAGRMTAGLVFSDIWVTGNLSYFSSGSVLQSPSTVPGADYDLWNAPGDPAVIAQGSLRIDGREGILL